eukprot:TRINITY_DN59947_c0_g1_i1.p1 TRINITY_DN59947_c0_g1~~TRINITY_DN59947_c0_g1_i1.p1  ORF type:complete len:174 (-),score=43.87 TRINITY_DN59947_c0_g1_i1:168-689(-)
MPNLVRTKMKKPAGAMMKRPSAAAAAESEEEPCRSGGQYALLACFAFGQGSSSSASFASILGEFDSKDDAEVRLREELDRVKNYAGDAFGSGAAEKFSKQTKVKKSEGLQQATSCLKGVVPRNDYIRFEVIEADGDRDAVAAAFFKQYGSGAKAIKWLDSYSFSDGLDMWLAV